MEPWPPRPDVPPPPPAPPAYEWAGYGWPAPPQAAPWGPPAGPSVVWAVLLWVFAIGSLIGALILGGLAAVGFWSDNQMKTHGVTTTATVTEVNHFADTYTVEFTTENGRSASAEIILPSATPTVGDQVEITYDPGDPAYATEAGSPEYLFMAAVATGAAVFALAAAVGSVVGAVLVHRARGKALGRAATW